MNSLEMSSYSEPDFSLAQDILNEFIEETMSEEEKERRRKATEDMYKRFMDDDYIASLGECF